MHWTANLLRKKRLPGQLIIQLTDRCNAACPQCGMRKSARFSRSRLSLGQVKRIMDAAARRDVQAVSFTGGEPLLLLDDLVELINHAGAAGIKYIRTGTNGFILRGSGQADFEARIGRLAARLAATPLRNFWISIDSAVASVHESMRGLPGAIAGIAKALPIFHAHGIDFFFVDARKGHTFPCGYRGNEDHGPLYDLRLPVDACSNSCHLCDWECFRDPSELFGPILQAVTHPAQLAGRIQADPLFFKLWLSDLFYYQASEFFNGRRAPAYRRLKTAGRIHRILTTLSRTGNGLRLQSPPDVNLST